MSIGLRNSFWKKKGGSGAPEAPNGLYFFSAAADANKCWGAVSLAPNGKIINGQGIRATALEIDTPAETQVSIESTTLAGAYFKFMGATLSVDGLWYLVPFANPSIQKVSPVDGSSSTFGSLGTSVKYWGSVLAPNGHIYAIPNNSATFGKIDTSTDTLTSHGSLGAGLDKWAGGALAPNGFIYCAPSRSASVLKIDPSTDTATTFGSLGATTTRKWIGACLGMDGKIYCAPHADSNILVIDPATDTTTLIPAFSGYSGCVSAPNGDIYFAPHNSLRFMRLLGGVTVDQFGTTLPSLNKYSGATLAPDGGIYYSPISVNNFARYKESWGDITEDMYTQPSPISGLAGSNYNIFQNKT